MKKRQIRIILLHFWKWARYSGTKEYNSWCNDSKYRSWAVDEACYSNSATWKQKEIADKYKTVKDEITMLQLKLEKQRTEWHISLRKGDLINDNYKTKTISWGANRALEEKGVLFNIMNEESAKEYLTQHNNYFKLTAYRKIMISILMEKTRENT